MPAEKISIENAKQNKLFYFVVNAAVYRKEDGRCLILKRHEREKVHPSKYALPGGKLEWEDLDLENVGGVYNDVSWWDKAIQDLIKREVLEEAGVEIYDGFDYIDNTVFVRPDGIPVVLFKFAVKYKRGEVKLEESAFTDYAWVNVEEIKEFDFIQGLDGQIARTTELYK